nr:ribonuclease H-like domain, reverse transcriptase, RNA-dependent DNA polymerase [Tanacetum cinerariifolium]
MTKTSQEHAMMDVKSDFLYGIIKDEVYVCQPSGFKDPHFSDKSLKDRYTRIPDAFYGGAHFLLRVAVKTVSTPIETNKALLKDKEVENVDVHLYRSMIGSLMYLTASRNDIMFAVCACARFQVTPKVSHLYDVKRIFRYLKVMNLELELDLNGCLDWNETTANDDIQAYTYYCQLKVSAAKSKFTTVGDVLATAKVKNVNEEAQLQALVDKKKVIITEASIRRDLSSTIASAIICLATNKKFNFSKYIFDNMVKHLDGGVKFMMYPRFVQVFSDNQVNGMDKHDAIFVISSHTKKKKQKSKRKQKKEIEIPSSSSEIPNEEGVPTTSNDPLPSDEDRMQLNELMILCTNLQKHVLDLEEAKTAQAKEITSLKKRVKKLQQKRKSRTSRLKRLRKFGSARRVESSTEASLGDQKDASKQGRLIDNINQDVEIRLVDDTKGRMNEEDMFRVNNLDGDEDELTLAQTLIEIKAAKPKAITTAATTVTTAGTRPKEKGIVMQETSETPSPKPIISSQKPLQAKDKGKGKMVEPEKPLKRKDQIMMDAETRAMMDANCELAARLQEEEIGELSIEEKSRLYVELMDKRKKHFARIRAKKIRSKPPTKAQKRNKMCTYLKNMENYKHNQLKNKSFKEIQMLFNNTIKWIEAFVSMDTELVKDSEKSAEGSDKAVEGSEKAEKGSSNRAGSNLEQEDAKRKRIEEENEFTELKICLEIDDNDVTIEATPLSFKYLTIVDYKIYKEGMKSYFKIIRADGNSQNYLTFGKMFKNFNREDLEVPWSMVKARFKKTKPIDDMDNMLFQTLKTMFEHHGEVSQSFELETFLFMWSLLCYNKEYGVLSPG